MVHCVGRSQCESADPTARTLLDVLMLVAARAASKDIGHFCGCRGRRGKEGKKLFKDSQKVPRTLQKGMFHCTKNKARKLCIFSDGASYILTPMKRSGVQLVQTQSSGSDSLFLIWEGSTTEDIAGGGTNPPRNNAGEKEVGSARHNVGEKELGSKSKPNPPPFHC